MHKISSPTEYFGLYISALKLPPNTQLQVDHLWSILEPHDQIWQGKRPTGVAAALIYKAASESGHKRTQAEICKVAKVSELQQNRYGTTHAPVWLWALCLWLMNFTAMMS